METIEERAIKFVDAPCDRRCEDCSTGQAGCRFYTDEVSFIYGARSEHAELTRWHDPKDEVPPNDEEVLCLTNQRYSTYAVLRYENNCWWQYAPIYGGGWFRYEGDVIVWREIHE